MIERNPNASVRDYMTEPQTTSAVTDSRTVASVEEGIASSLKARLAEGDARHNERKARLAGAVFVRSLDGYVISEADLLKLLDNQKV